MPLSNNFDAGSSSAVFGTSALLGAVFAVGTVFDAVLAVFRT